jgi:two-component system response regulator AtoC
MPIESILIVDDEPLICEYLTQALQRKKFKVNNSRSYEEALQLLEKEHFDLFLIDMKLGRKNGLDLLDKIKSASPNSLCIVMTGYASIETAIDAMRLGAFDYLVKPFAPETLTAFINKASEHFSLKTENNFWRDKGKTPFIAKSPSLLRLQAELKRIAASNASVFITGESGTGKEVVANAIHQHSLRENKPFIRINCAAVPETLIESEFFGHEKGAFTGAMARRLGRFELAHEGTLLLDEVTEIPSHLQAKMLRVLQEQEFERVGGNTSVKVDVRIISTSNRNLEDAIRQKVLREDLFWRLNVIPIHIPPLRERKEDILPLAHYFLTLFCSDYHKVIKQLSKQAEEKLLSHPWHGNVRELKNLMERVVVLSDDHSLNEELIFDGLKNPFLPQGLSLQELEMRYIIETLSHHNQDKVKAAEQLGIQTHILEEKIRSDPKKYL